MEIKGDRPNIIILFKENNNMNVNEIDENDSTPLHLAYYMNREICINYILTWINHKDVNL